MMLVFIDGKGYDVSEFAAQHPGGERVLRRAEGQDVTQAFHLLHPAHVRAMLPRLLARSSHAAAPAAAPCDSRLREAMRKVHEELVQRKLYEPANGFYARLALWLAALFVGALALTLNGAWRAGALLTAAFWQQAAGLGHDLGHSSVFRKRAHNLWAGSLLSVVTGLSSVWWRDDHFSHHLDCNVLEADPNIQHLPLFAVTDLFFVPSFSTYHERRMQMTRVSQALVAHQHLLFYPLMTIARFQLYALGVAHLLRTPRDTHARVELLGIGIFAVAVASLALCQATLSAALGWTLLSHAAAGILHVQIVVSHWAMDVLHASSEWFAHTLKTTLDIKTDYNLFHIGLQFQIEHHMFPRLPRPHLPEARRLVKRALAELGEDAPPYVELSFWDANVRTFKHLKTVARGARLLQKL